MKLKNFIFPIYLISACILVVLGISALWNSVTLIGGILSLIIGVLLLFVSPMIPIIVESWGK